MRRLIPAALALAVTACAGTPEHAWQPTDPSFGRDQAVAEQAFCIVMFDGLAAAAQKPEDKDILTRLGSATALRLAQLGAGPNDPNVRLGERHAIVFAFGASSDQLVAAGERCVEIAMVGR